LREIEAECLPAIFTLMTSTRSRIKMISSSAKRSRATTHGPSFLRWAGSKRQSLEILKSTCTDIALEYVEPFAGSAALFFEIAPGSATLADLNSHLINALRHVRDEPARVHQMLLRFKRNKTTFYGIRESFNEGPTHGITQAVNFIYLNRNCFNGLWRTNLSGLFNVPFGGDEMGEYPPLRLFEHCSSLLSRARLRNQDFRKTIADTNGKSFIYADPPYFATASRIFVEYGRKSFNQEDLKDLIHELVAAERRGARVALTYSDAMCLRGIPKHWNRMKFSVTRNVGGFSGTRRKQSEILYTSFAH
jgi:DNA adenine methylase